VIVAFSEAAEQPLDLDALAIGKEHLKTPRAQIAKSLHQDIRLVKGFALWKLVEQFEEWRVRARTSSRDIPIALAAV
jgi:hypothetical protein